MLPAPQLLTLGLQHVLVMYAGAITVPLTVGRVLQIESQDVAFLISADLFACGVVSIAQSLGLTRWRTAGTERRPQPGSPHASRKEVRAG